MVKLHIDQKTDLLILLSKVSAKQNNSNDQSDAIIRKA